MGIHPDTIPRHERFVYTPACRQKRNRYAFPNERQNKGMGIRSGRHCRNSVPFCRDPRCRRACSVDIHDSDEYPVFPCGRRRRLDACRLYAGVKEKLMDTKEIISRIHVKQGDIVLEESDAIVNAANPSLLGGGGVDGAIHRAAGPKLLEECRALGGCLPGEARITGGYNLRARHVIHTPGPVYRGGEHGEETILRNSYVNSLRLAMEHGLTSISFPAISAGVYGYPKTEACRIAVSSIIGFMKETGRLLDVTFVLFDGENCLLYKEFLKNYLNRF